jgi:hypothetical protein
MYQYALNVVKLTQTTRVSRLLLRRQTLRHVPYERYSVCFDLILSLLPYHCLGLPTKLSYIVILSPQYRHVSDDTVFPTRTRSQAIAFGEELPQQRS